MLEIYQSRAFSTEIVRTFKQLNPEDQDWDGANSYFETAMLQQEEIERLMGGSPRAGMAGDINTALEENFKEIFERFDDKVDDRVREVVLEAIEEAMAKKAATSPSFSAGTTAGPDVTKQINDLKSEVGVLRSQLANAIKTLKNGGGGGGGNRNTTISNKPTTGGGDRPARQTRIPRCSSDATQTNWRGRTI